MNGWREGQGYAARLGNGLIAAAAASPSQAAEWNWRNNSGACLPRDNSAVIAATTEFY
jgi:hypothetical protein